MDEPPARLNARSTIRQVARLKIFDDLGGLELLVYLRVLASAGEWSKTKITNHALRPGDSRAVVRALRSLEQLGLIALAYEPGGSQTTRTIEVLR